MQNTEKNSVEFLHPLGYYARLDECVYKKGKKLEAYERELNVTRVASKVIQGWKVSLYQNNESKECMVVGRGSDNTRNWWHNFKSFIYMGDSDRDVMFKFECIVREWQRNCGKALCTGHSAAARNLSTFKGLYFNGDKCDDNSGSINLRTENDFLTESFMTRFDAKSLTIGPGKHGIKDIIKAADSSSFEKYYEIRSQKIEGHTLIPFDAIPPLGQDDFEAIDYFRGRTKEWDRTKLSPKNPEIDRSYLSLARCSYEYRDENGKYIEFRGLEAQDRRLRALDLASRYLDFSKPMNELDNQALLSLSLQLLDGRVVGMKNAHAILEDYQKYCAYRDYIPVSYITKVEIPALGEFSLSMLKAHYKYYPDGIPKDLIPTKPEAIAFGKALPYFDRSKEITHPYNQAIYALTLKLENQVKDSELNKILNDFCAYKKKVEGIESRKEERSKLSLGAARALEMPSFLRDATAQVEGGNLPVYDTSHLRVMKKSLEGAAELVEQATALEKELSRVEKQKVIAHLLSKVATIVENYSRLSKVEKGFQSREKDLLRQQFEINKKLLGVKLNIEELTGFSVKQIQDKIATAVLYTEAPAKLIDVHQLDQAFDQARERIELLEGYLSQRSALQGNLTVDSSRMKELDQNIQKEFRAASHQWSYIHKGLNIVLAGVSAITIVNPLCAVAVAVAVAGSQELIGSSREKDLQIVQNQFDNLNDARRHLQDISERNQNRASQIKAQLDGLLDFCCQNPLLFDPNKRLLTLNLSYEKSIRHESELQKRISENRAEFFSAKGSIGLHQFNNRHDLVEQAKMIARACEENNLRYQEALEECRSKKRLIEENIEQHKRLESYLVKGREWLESRQQPTLSKLTKSLEKCKKVEADLRNQQAAYTTKPATKRQHLENIRKQRQGLFETEKLILQKQIDECVSRREFIESEIAKIEETKEFRQLFSELSKQTITQLQYELGPIQGAIVALHNFTEGLNQVYRFKKPVIVADILASSVEAYKQIQLLKANWELISTTIDKKGWNEAFAIVGKVGFLTSIVIPGLQVAALGLSLYHLGTSLFQKEQENPNQALADLFLNGMKAVVECQSKQIEELKVQLYDKMTEEFKDNRKRLDLIFQEVDEVRLDINAITGEIVDELKKLEYRQEKKIDEQNIISFNDLVKGKRDEIGDISSRLSLKPNHLASLNKFLKNTTDLSLNGWLEEHGLFRVPLASLPTVPSWHTGLLARKLNGEDSNCPSLYLYTEALYTFIMFLEKLNSNKEILKTWNKEAREEILTTYLNAKKLGFELIEFLSKDTLELFIERALNAKTALKDAVVGNRRKVLDVKEMIHRTDLVQGEIPSLRFDFNDHFSESRRIGAGKFIFSNLFHNNSLQMGFGTKRFVEDMGDQLPKIWFTSTVESCKEALETTLEKVQLNMQSLISKQLDYSPVRGQLKVSDSLLSRDSVDVSVWANIFFCNREKQMRRYFSLSAHFDAFNVPTSRSPDQYYNDNPKSLINLALQVSYKGGQVLDYSFETVSKPYAGGDSLIQIEDWQKIPPRSVMDLQKYDDKLQQLLNDYQDYLKSKLFLESAKPDNLFCQRMSLNDEECILASVKANGIPLTLPKTFLDYWKKRLQVDSFNLEASGDGALMCFYDFAQSSEEGPWQLVIEFRYLNTKGSELKNYGRVVIAQFDKKTVESFRKINFEAIKKPVSYSLELVNGPIGGHYIKVERPPSYIHDYRIDGNVNEFLFQAMYGSLLKEGGLPDDKSYYLKSGTFVAAHETRFDVDVYTLLEHHPEIQMTFDSRLYNSRVNALFKNYIETGNATGIENFLKPAVFECSRELPAVSRMIRQARQIPLKEKFEEFKEYEESYHLLHAFIELVSEENDLSGAMKKHLGLISPDSPDLFNRLAIKSRPRAFIKQTMQSPSTHLTDLLEQMDTLDHVFETLNETLYGGEKEKGKEKEG